MQLILSLLCRFCRGSRGRGFWLVFIVMVFIAVFEDKFMQSFLILIQIRNKYITDIGSRRIGIVLVYLYRAIDRDLAAMDLRGTHKDHILHVPDYVIAF